MTHTLSIDDLSEPVTLLRYAGHEKISELFAFDLDVVSEQGIQCSDVVGKRAHFTFGCANEPRNVHGIVQRFERGEEASRQITYHAIVVPLVWRLTCRRTSRIFQHLTVPQIIEQVLVDARVNDFEISLSGNYGERDYCVQYLESDWAFLSRLMEHEGIFYYFEHHEDISTLRIADNASAHIDISGDSTLLYRADTGALGQDEHVYSLRFGEEIRSGKVTLTDYNFMTPSLSLEHRCSAEQNVDLEFYEHHGQYDAPPHGHQLTTRRLESVQSSRRSGVGKSCCARLAPGFLFALADNPNEDANRRFLVTTVDHEGSAPHAHAAIGEDASYRNNFTVIPAEIPFRPPAVTPRPSVRGVQTALVVGPNGEEIYTDALGRVKVQFHWDRTGRQDDQSSCWIRVQQAWAGPGCGSLFIPRVGHEVVVDFINGDPDRPLITGSVYHTKNVPPHTLPDAKTRSTIRTRSTSGGDEGSNELTFEDARGAEEIYIHAQKDWAVSVEHDKNQRIGNDMTLVVECDRKKEVRNDQSEIVGCNKSSTVGGSHAEVIGGGETLSVGAGRVVTIGGEHVETIALAQITTVGGTLTQNVGAMVLTVRGPRSETVQKCKSSKIAEGYDVEVGAGMNLKVVNDYREEVDKNKILNVGERVTIQCGQSTIEVRKDGSVEIFGKNVAIQGKGAIKVVGKRLQIESKGGVNLKASGKIKVKGSKVGLN